MGISYDFDAVGYVSVMVSSMYAKVLSVSAEKTSGRSFIVGLDVTKLLTLYIQVAI